MDRRAKYLFVAILLLGGTHTVVFGRQKVNATSNDNGITVIPRLEQCAVGSGAFTLGPSTQIIVLSNARQIPFFAEYCAAQMRAVTGFPLTLRVSVPTPKANVVLFEYVGDDKLRGEGYTLEVTRDKVRIRAVTDAGHFYAVQTLLQLLPKAAFGTKLTRGVRWSIPCLGALDRPQFPWRGMHLDVSSHFFPEFIKTYIDLLALQAEHVSLAPDRRSGWG
jgi:hexosaminidase